MSYKQLLKALRDLFRTSVLDRDGHRCRKCGTVPENGDDGLDAHHIVDRHEMPVDGYSILNGITLCQAECHRKAEAEHEGRIPEPGFSRTELYALIGSSYDEAFKACLAIEDDIITG